MRILLVEDHEQLGDSLHKALLVEQYACDWIKRGDQVLTTVRSVKYHLFILDIGLPCISGFGVLAALRKRRLKLPVLMLTTRDSTKDKVTGFDLGADDYRAKPFDLDELYARIRVLLRRDGGQDNNVYRFGNCTFDSTAREVRQGETRIDITATEMAILYLLLRNQDRYVSRERLEDGVYAWGREVESNTVQVYISRLRKRFGVELIETKRGIGYRISL